MDRMHEALASMLFAGLLFGATPAVAQAAEYHCQLYGTSTDGGQVVSRMDIGFGEAIDPESVEAADFTVHATGSSKRYQDMFGEIGINTTWTSDYDIDRTIVKTEVNDSVVSLYFNEGEGATVSYLVLEGEGIPTTGSGRTMPVDLTYTVALNSDITTANGDTIKGGDFAVDTEVKDDEIALFESVIVEDGVNYQFHKGTNDTLIIWFHGGGEADQDNLTKNNVTQILGSRGGVAWTSEEAQQIFGDASVMAFQAPNRWYQGDQAALYTRCYDEIMQVVEENGISKDKLIVTGCSMGGYMSTKMMMKYPDLFSVALLACPDTNMRRVEPVPTDDDLKAIAETGTKVWVVQADVDESVGADSSERLFNNLAGDQEIRESKVDQDNASSYTTYETADGSFLRTVYETIDEDGAINIVCEEDYDQDGTPEPVSYNNHFTWIYLLRNKATSADGTSIWQWAANAIGSDVAPFAETAGTSEGATESDSSSATPLVIGGAALAAIAAGAFAIRRKK